MTEDQNTPQLAFGITQETKTSNATAILVAEKIEGSTAFPNGWKFPIAKLVNVVYNPTFEKKDKEIVAILDFIFVDADKRKFTHREWEIPLSDASLKVKMDGQASRIAHIYSELLGLVPAEGIGTGATSFKEFFAKVEEQFNAGVTVKDEKTIKNYTINSAYIKLTYYKKNYGFPLSPNFLERVVQGKPCTSLTIHPVHDKLEPPKTGGAGGGIPGMGAPSGDDLPSFGGGGNNFG